MLFRTLLGASALLLAAPLAAADSLAQGTPPVADGDMGCFVAVGLFAMKAADAADDASSSTEDRTKARVIGDKLMINANLFYGRLMLSPPEKRSGELYHETFGRIMALKPEDQAKYAKDCLAWADKARNAQGELWKKK